MSAQTRLQKGLIPRPGQNDTFQISGPGWVWIRNFDRLPSLLYAEQRRAWFGNYHPASLPQKNMRKNVLNNQHGNFCESGISACPESVGVGKFCRLRLRLRLRGKQPTPTDSDSSSDSDSAALDVTTFKVMFFSSCLNHTYVSVMSPHYFFTYSANKTLISIPSIPCILDVTDTDANQAQKEQRQTTIQ